MAQLRALADTLQPTIDRLEDGALDQSRHWDEEIHLWQADLSGSPPVTEHAHFELADVFDVAGDQGWK